MPSSLTCDLCGEEHAISMITRLANGDSLAVGEACQLTFHLAVAAELIKAMPAELTAAYDDAANVLLAALATSRAGSDGLLPADPASDTGGGTAGGRVLAEYGEYQITDSAPDTTEPPAPAEGTADEHAADLPQRLDGHGSPAAGTDGAPD